MARGVPACSDQWSPTEIRSWLGEREPRLGVHASAVNAAHWRASRVRPGEGSQPPNASVFAEAATSSRGPAEAARLALGQLAVASDVAVLAARDQVHGGLITDRADL